MMFCRWLAIAVAAGVSAAGQEPPKFSSEVTLVRLDVRVADARGPVRNLRAADFVIVDDDAPQSVLDVVSENARVDVLLLVDFSSSIRPVAAQLERAARAAVDVLLPDDRIALWRFGGRANVILSLTNDREALARALQELRNAGFESSTDLYRALCDSVHCFERSEPRRIILMISDGLGGRRQREAATLRDLWEADATVDALVVGPTLAQWRRSYSPDRDQAQDLGLITRETGGSLVKTSMSSDALETSLRDLFANARASYSIFYREPESLPGRFHRVHVDLSPEARKLHPAARVSARSGYYASH